jgi:tRNA G18 (ribose-2'-O)-methylase SpoU
MMVCTSIWRTAESFGVAGVVAAVACRQSNNKPASKQNIIFI